MKTMLDLSNKSKYVYFDSSAYNCLLDDAKRGQVIEAMKGQKVRHNSECY
jgi:hypothetical protein